MSTNCLECFFADAFFFMGKSVTCGPVFIAGRQGNYGLGIENYEEVLLGKPGKAALRFTAPHSWGYADCLYLPRVLRVEVGIPSPADISWAFRVPYRVRETWAPKSMTAEDI